MGSSKFKLDLTDVVQLLKMAALVGGASALTYIGQNLSDLDLGSIGTLIVPVVAVVVDAAIKWLKNNDK